MLKFYQLPPVGNAVSTLIDDNRSVESIDVSPSFSQRFYASGTAALAAALVATLKMCEKKQKPGKPEILLPAYACPDLISATVFAGIKPVLVDFEMQSPWLQLAELESLITDNTVAILAVNLFGISERWPLLRTLADKYNLVLIEDSAQYFPGANDAYHWQGDLVVLSFGRGKPVSLLGGGAVLCRDNSLFDFLPVPVDKPVSAYQRYTYRLKAKLYNTMISPYLYWLPQSLPFLHLGETRYHTLPDIEAMASVRLELLAQNITCYQSDLQAIIRCQEISSMLASLATEVSGVTDLPVLCGVSAKRRLLRYPILLEAGVRDQVYRKLQQSGLGASIMYPASLPKITGLSNFLDAGQSCTKKSYTKKSSTRKNFPGAEEFASRIITLPTHQYVSSKRISEIKLILKDALQ